MKVGDSVVIKGTNSEFDGLKAKIVERGFNSYHIKIPPTGECLEVIKECLEEIPGRKAYYKNGTLNSKVKL